LSKDLGYCWPRTIQSRHTIILQRSVWCALGLRCHEVRTQTTSAPHPAHLFVEEGDLREAHISSDERICAKFLRMPLPNSRLHPSRSHGTSFGLNIDPFTVLSCCCAMCFFGHVDTERSPRFSLNRFPFLSVRVIGAGAQPSTT